MSKYSVTLVQEKTFEVESKDEIDEQIDTELSTPGWELVDVDINIL